VRYYIPTLLRFVQSYFSLFHSFTNLSRRLVFTVGGGVAEARGPSSFSALPQSRIGRGAAQAENHPMQRYMSLDAYGEAALGIDNAYHSSYVLSREAAVGR
jgi:hypothetical protein